MNFISI